MKSNSASFPIASILTIVFVVLKLTKVITWSWWWVLSPLWIAFAVALIVVGGLALAVLIRTMRRSKP